MVTQTGLALFASTLCVLSFLDYASPPVVIALGVGVGVLIAFSLPAQNSLVVGLVDSKDLPTAIALNSMSFNVSRIIGPGLGALTVATLGIRLRLP